MTRCALAAAVVLLALPAPAGATITASTVDTTGGPFFGVDENSAGLVIHGHVTSDAPSTDKVKLVCDGYGEVLGPGNAGFSINPDGSVDAAVGISMDYYYCLARFVPLAASAPYDPAFVPSPIGVLGYYDTSFAPPDDAGGPYDWWQSASGPSGYADGLSLGACAFWSTYTIKPDYGYQQLLQCSGVFAKDPADTTRSMVRLDDVDALLPSQAHDRAFAPADVPRITNLHRDINHQTGEVSVSDTEPLALCPSSCSSPTPAGVHADHSFHVDHGGRLATTVDVWRNDRSVPVALDVSYVFELQMPTGQYQLPGDIAFGAVPDGALPTPPAGPGFMRAVGNPGQADGAADSVRGAIAWSTAPDALVGDAADRGVILRYHRTVPAGGSFTITLGTGTALSQADADALAADMIAATQPATGITAPDGGATTTSDSGIPAAPSPVVAPTVIAPSLKHVTVKVSRHGTVTVSADVPSAGAFAATLRAKAGKRRLTIGSAKKTVGAARRVTVKLKPSKTARAALRNRGLRATLALSFTNSTGNSATASRHVKLKRVRRGR